MPYGKPAAAHARTWSMANPVSGHNVLVWKVWAPAIAKSSCFCHINGICVVWRPWMHSQKRGVPFWPLLADRNRPAVSDSLCSPSIRDTRAGIKVFAEQRWIFNKLIVVSYLECDKWLEFIYPIDGICSGHQWLWVFFPHNLCVAAYLFVRSFSAFHLPQWSGRQCRTRTISNLSFSAATNWTSWRTIVYLSLDVPTYVCVAANGSHLSRIFYISRVLLWAEAPSSAICMPCLCSIHQ